MVLCLAAGANAESSVPKSGAIAVDAYNGLAATADRFGAVKLFDATNAGSPKLLSTTSVPRTITGVALSGNYLLVSGQGGVQILDISNPKAPVFRNNVALDQQAKTVKAAGNIGFTAFESTVVLFDIVSGQVLDQHSYSALPVDDLAVAGDFLYVVSAEADSGAGFQLFKLPIKTQLGPALASWTSATGRPGPESLSLFAGDNLVYVGSVLADGPSPSSGVEIVQDSGTSFQLKGAAQPIDAAVVRPSKLGLLAYTGAEDPSGATGSLGLLNTSDPSNTGKVLQTFKTAGRANSVVLYRGFAYVASNTAGLQAIPYAATSGSKRLPTLALATSSIPEAPVGGNLVRMTANVTAVEQVANVDFFLNGEKVASDGNYPFEYRFNDSGLDLASATVYACAEDIDGNASCTDPVGLNTDQQKASLLVTAVTPGDSGHTPRTDKYSISAQFSLPLDTRTVSVGNVTLTKAATKSTPEAAIRLSGVTYHAATKSISLQPKLALTSGIYKVSLSSAIKSTSGSAMSGDYIWNFAIDGVTDTWTSPINGDWNVGKNWSLGTPPANGDSAVINIPGVVVTTSSTSGSPIIGNLTVAATNTINIAGANLSIESTGVASIAGSLNLSSGSLGGPGTTNVTGTMTWTGGGVTGVLNIPAKSVLAINTPFDTSFYLSSGGVINNSGTVNQTFAGTAGQYEGLQISQGAVINNLTGGVWNLNSDVWMQSTDSTAIAFKNSGTLNKTGGANTSLWSVPISGSGPINLQIGVLRLNGTLTGALAAPIYINTNTTLDYGQGGTLDGGKVTGAGTLTFEAATVVSGAYSFSGLTQIQTGSSAINFENATTLSSLNLISGALAGAGPVTVTGTMTWTGGGVTGVLDIPAKAVLAINTPFDTNFYLNGGAVINNSGTVNQTFAGVPGQYVGLQVAQSAVINNLPGGVWNVASDVWMQTTDNTAVAFKNSGTFNKIGGSTTSLWSMPISGSGAINVQLGDLRLNGQLAGALAAPIAISPNSTLDYAQGGTLNGGKVTGSGTFNFDTATVVSGAYSFAGLTQIQTGSAAINFENATTLSSLNLISGAVAGAGPVTVTGTMTWTGGGVTGVLNVATKAVMAINTPFDTTFYLNGGGVINNTGTVNQTFAGTPDQYVGLQMSQGAVINNLTGGIWNVTSDVWMQNTDNTAAFKNTGVFNKTGGANTSLWSVPISGPGAINLQIGDLHLNGQLTGMLAAPIYINARTTLDYGQGGTLDGGKVTGAGTLNFDTATVVSGTYSFAGLTQIQSGNSAISFQNATTLASLNLISGAIAGAGTVTVTGTMTWTGGGVTSVLNIPAKAVLAINTPFDTTFYLSGGGVINNGGTVNQTFSGTPAQYIGFQVSQSATINNLAGGIWNVNSDVWMQTTDNTVVAFNNIGIFNKVGGTNTSLWSVPISGPGAINVQTGDLRLNGGLTGMLAAPIYVNARATLDYAQGGTLDGGKVTGAGTLNFDTATLVSGTYSFAGLTQIQSGNNAVNFQNATTIAALNLISGGVAGAGPVTVTGTMTWTGGGVATILNIPASAILAINTLFDTPFYLNDGGVINNSGTVNQTFAGTPGQYVGFQVAQSAVINNLSGGVWNVNSDVWMQTTDNTAVAFINSGTLNKTGGVNTSLWSVPISGSGSINIQEGSLSLNGFAPSSNIGGKITIGPSSGVTYQQGGTFSAGAVQGTGTLTFSSQANVTGAFSFKGTTQIQGGQVVFTGTAQMSGLNLMTNSSISASGVVTVSGELNWSGGSIGGTAAFNINSLNVSPSSSVTLKIATGSVLNVTAKIDLAGNLTLSLPSTGWGPTVGTVVQAITFANGFLGNFGNIFNTTLSNGDVLKANLTSTGLTFTVTN